MALTAEDVVGAIGADRAERSRAGGVGTQLDVILESVARVSEVAAQDIPPTSHALPLTNVFREDELRPSLPRDRYWPAHRLPSRCDSGCRESWGKRHELQQFAAAEIIG